MQDDRVDHVLALEIVTREAKQRVIARPRPCQGKVFLMQYIAEQPAKDEE